MRRPFGFRSTRSPLRSRILPAAPPAQQAPAGPPPGFPRRAGYNARHEVGLRRTAGALRARGAPPARRPRRGLAVLPAAGPDPLRELHRRLAAPAAAALAALPRRLRLLPLGRRPRRRGRRGPAGAGAVGVVARG